MAAAKIVFVRLTNFGGSLRYYAYRKMAAAKIVFVRFGMKAKHKFWGRQLPQTLLATCFLNQGQRQTFAIFCRQWRIQD